MRPHISSKEALYLKVVLENESRLLSEKLQKINNLTNEVHKLKSEFLRTGSYSVFQKFKTKQEELSVLTQVSYLDLCKSLDVNAALIQKYSVMPTKKKGGRYSAKAVARLYPSIKAVQEALAAPDPALETVQ